MKIQVITLKIKYIPLCFGEVRCWIVWKQNTKECVDHYCRLVWKGRFNWKKYHSIGETNKLMTNDKKVKRQVPTARKSLLHRPYLRIKWLEEYHRLLKGWTPSLWGRGGPLTGRGCGCWSVYRGGAHGPNGMHIGLHMFSWCGLHGW